MTIQAPQNARQSLLELIDMLPDQECIGVYHAILTYIRQHDPVLWALLTASEDDEPLTEEDIIAIEEGKKDLAEGRWITGEELERRMRDS